MGDENFDPCECIWGHELAMRRLISLLRQSQSYCTDSECFQDGPLSPGGSSSDQNHGLIVLTMFFAFALLMYLLRPKQQQTSEPQKFHLRDNDRNNGGFPPNPPPAIN